MFDFFNTKKLKILEEKLKASEEKAARLESLVENTIEAFALVDLDGREQLLRYVNPAWERLFGYTKEDVVDKRRGLIVEAAKRDKNLFKKFAKAIAEHKPFMAEMEWKKKNGAVIPVEVYSIPIREAKMGKFIWFNAIRDIAERKQGEGALKKEKEICEKLAKDLEKFKSAVDGASDMIVIDSAEGELIYANNALEMTTGYTLQESIGKKTGSLWGGHMSKDFYAEMWNIIKTQKKPFLGEITNRRKNGEDYVAELHISPILDDKGDVQFFVGIERDITKAKEVDKMKSEFVSVASHQLRTPLTAIKWYSELLLKTKLTKKVKDHIEQISESNERMIELVGDLLSVARIETGKKFDVETKKVDIIPLVKEVIEVQEVLAKSKAVTVKLDKNFPERLELFIDSDKIRMVFMNLLSNAVKYSPQGDVIVGCNPQNTEIVFYVKDSGIGIPEKQKEKVFQKFFRADNVFALQTDGTGLGLYIVKAIVEGHNGKIWFESEEGKGATFYFSLPNS